MNRWDPTGAGAAVPVTVLVGDTPVLPLIEGMIAEQTDTVAILDTTFGRIGMDVSRLSLPPVTGQRTPDCGCCQARLDLVDGLRILVERPTPPSHIVVCVGGDDDIATVVRTMLSDPDLDRLTRLDAVIATVDAATLSTRLALDLPLAEQRQAEHLAIADRVMIMGSHKVTHRTRQQVIRAVSIINRVGFVLDPDVDRIGWSDVAEIDGWHGAPLTKPRPTAIPPQTHLVDGLETVTCWVNGAVNPPAFDEWINDIVTGNSSRILRLQGALRINGQVERTCLRGVRSFVSSHSESEHAAHRRSRHSVLAIVGNDLDAATIRSGFLSTITA